MLLTAKNGVFAIKPSGVPYEDLKPEDIVIVDFDNNIIEGSMRPSSDTKTHAYLYKNWPNIGGVAHTHATYSVAWAQSQQDIPIFGTTHADHLTSDIPCAAPMADHLSKETTNTIPEFKSWIVSKKKTFRTKKSK